MRYALFTFTVHLFDIAKSTKSFCKKPWWLGTKKDKKVAKVEWKKMESVLDLIDFSDGTAKFNKRGKELIEQSNLDSELELIGSLSAKITSLNEQLDGVLTDIGRTWANRNVAASLVLVHRGWLSSMIQKIKNKKKVKDVLVM